MREFFGALFLITACALTWGQVALFALGNYPGWDVIGIMIGLTLIAFTFSLVASARNPHRVLKCILSFIGGGQSLALVVAMALSITGYAIHISTQGPGYLFLFGYVIGFGVYAAIVGELFQSDDSPTTHIDFRDRLRGVPRSIQPRQW